MKLSAELLAAATADSLRRREPTLGLRDLFASKFTLTGPQQEQFDRRRVMLSTIAVEPLADAFERIIGRNDLLPINISNSAICKARLSAGSVTGTAKGVPKRWRRVS